MTKVLAVGLLADSRSPGGDQFVCLRTDELLALGAPPAGRQESIGRPVPARSNVTRERDTPSPETPPHQAHDLRAGDQAGASASRTS